MPLATSANFLARKIFVAARGDQDNGDKGKIPHLSGRATCCTERMVHLAAQEVADNEHWLDGALFSSEAAVNLCWIRGAIWGLALRITMPSTWGSWRLCGMQRIGMINV